MAGSLELSNIDLGLYLDGDHQERPGAAYVCPSIGMDLELSPTVADTVRRELVSVVCYRSA